MYGLTFKFPMDAGKKSQAVTKEMDPEVLMARWPWMDYLMAETLIKAHERGTLQAMAESWPDGRHPSARDETEKNEED